MVDSLRKLLPQSFSARLIAMTFLSGLIPMVVFGVLLSVFGDRFLNSTSTAIQIGQEEQIHQSETILRQLAENFIRQKAFDAALQIDLYLEGHPGVTLPQLLQDETFNQLAVQPVGKTGYTVIFDASSGVTLFHPEKDVIGTTPENQRAEIPEFWKITNASLGGKYSHGYYRWRETDGTISDKFMYIVPLESRLPGDLRLNLAATAYVNEFTRPIQAAISSYRGTAHLLQHRSEVLIDSLRSTGLILMGISALVLFGLALLTGIYFSRAIRHLRSVTKTVNSGSYDLAPPPHLSGDIGQLIRDFHRMAETLKITTVRKDRLEQTEAALRAYRDELEQLVNQRTEQLSEANRLLREEVDERRQAEAALETSQQRLNAILQASPVGIGLVINRTLDWANGAMYQLVDYPEGSLLGRDSRLLYENDEEYRRVGRELTQKALDGGTGKVTTRWVRRDGSLRDVFLRSYFLDPGEPAQGLIVAATDITESRRLEEELRRAQKMEALGTLAGGVAHDLNNILSSIVSYPELILLDLPEDVDPVLPTLVTRIKKSGEQAAAVVQDLLTMARRGVAVTEPVGLNRLVRELCQGIEFEQLKTRHPKISCVMELSDEELVIDGSEPHITKSLLNLLTNAAESMENGGLITVRTDNILLEETYQGFEPIAPGNYAILAVSDQGSGIPPENLSHIFEPFFTTKKMGRSGSGLGMAVVWGTVKDHNGFIDVRSSDLGTVFTLYFPLSKTSELQESPVEELGEIMGSGESVLIVDDSLSQREICSKLLTVLNYRPTAVESGEAAVTYLKENQADLVILDMIMDNMDGLDTFREIYRFKPGQKLIIASGFSENERVREIQKHSGCLYIKKPYTMTTLGKAILSTLAKR